MFSYVTNSISIKTEKGNYTDRTEIVQTVVSETL